MPCSRVCSTFSRIQMTDVDSRPDICFPSPPLADWTDITFPTVSFHINRVCLKQALPIMQQIPTVYTSWPNSFLWMLWNIYFHSLIMCTITWFAHILHSQCLLGTKYSYCNFKLSIWKLKMRHHITSLASVCGVRVSCCNRQTAIYSITRM